MRFIPLLRDGLVDTFKLPRRFESAQMEEAFLAYYCARFASTRRASAALGVITWAVYLLIDKILWDLDESLHIQHFSLNLVRAIGIPALAGFVLLSFHKRFEQDEPWAAKVILSGCIGMSCLNISLVELAPFPYNYLYYFQGLMVALIFCFGMFRLRAHLVAQLMLSVTAVSLGALWIRVASTPSAHSTIPFQVSPWIATLFMLTIAVVGYGIGVQLERSERRSYFTQQSMAQANLALSQQTQESERLYTALLEAKEHLRAQAEQNSREKSRFLAQAVHDLKQPLQAIGNALYPAKLAHAQGDSATALELMTLAETAADTMRSQLGSILDISRLESGLVKATLSEFELTRVIRDTVALQVPVAQSHQVILLLSPFLNGPVVVHSDVHFVERVLLNLIGNSIKYRDPLKQDQAHVLVSLDTSEGKAAITVTDNGIGIAQEHLDSGAIFAPFFQVNNHLAEDEKGFGLGLAIVKAMIALLPDHDLSTESTLGLRTTFRFALPQLDPLNAPDSATPRMQASAQKVENNPDPSTDFHTLVGTYIVLVEDDPLVRRSTMALFNSMGMSYEAYDSFEQMLKSAASLEREPDLVLSDYRLPNGKTAIDVIDTLKAIYPDIATLVFSGEITDLGTLHVHKNITFLRKPITAHSLLSAMTLLLNTARR